MKVVLLLLATVGCVHQVAWEVQPRPSYTLPALQVSVVALDRGCKHVADDLVEALGARPGVEVRPGAGVQLGVHDCDDGNQTNIEVEFQFGGLRQDGGLVQEQRRYHQRAWATAEITVHGPGAPVTLLGNAERTNRSQWEDARELDVPGLFAMREGLRRDLARDLADQVAPLPETIRRLVYRDPEPGTARQLHNQAVDAERGGDLQAALQLAQEAYAANPSPGALAYIEDLKAHAESVGYALRLDSGAN
jgi:hypothetical protein